MKTKRSYHPQNGFETNRRLLTLPHKIVWIVVSEELTAILALFAVVYLIRATLRTALLVLFFLLR